MPLIAVLTWLVLWRVMTLSGSYSSSTTTVRIMAIQEFELYIDGVKVFEGNNQSHVFTKAFNRDASVIAVMVVGPSEGMGENAGFIMSTDSGYYTDAWEWKYSDNSNVQSTFMQPSFDDSFWVEPLEFAPFHGEDLGDQNFIPQQMDGYDAINHNSQWLMPIDLKYITLFYYRGYYRDPCWKQKPCMNGAVCTNIDNSHDFQCACTDNWSEKTCAVWCQDHCEHGGTCRDHISYLKCYCVPGFTGSNCETDINECISEPCTNEATCLDQINSHACVCQSGYEGDLCQNDIDECSSSPCQNGGACNDTLNAFNCACPAGWTGVVCDADALECSSQPCNNDATCMDEFNSYFCYCLPGFEGTHCEQDINECLSLPCQFGGTCMDDVNGYTCGCGSAYTGQMCQTELSECGPDTTPCLHGGSCIDYMNTMSEMPYSCRCLSGYEGVHCETDINECSSAPCAESGICVDNINKYTCACKSGFSGERCEQKEVSSTGSAIEGYSTMPYSGGITPTPLPVKWSLAVFKSTAYSMLLHWETGGVLKGPFTISYRLKGQSQWQVFKTGVWTPDLEHNSSVVVNGLKAASTYELQVEERTSKSEPLLVKTRSLPSPPDEVSFKSNGSFIEASWKEPDSDFDRTVVRYCSSKINCASKVVPKGTNSVKISKYSDIMRNMSCTFVIKHYQHDDLVATSKEFQFNSSSTDLTRDNNKSVGPNVSSKWAAIGAVCCALVLGGIAALVLFVRKRKDPREEVRPSLQELIEFSRYSGLETAQNSRYGGLVSAQNSSYGGLVTAQDSMYGDLVTAHNSRYGGLSAQNTSYGGLINTQNRSYGGSLNTQNRSYGGLFSTQNSLYGGKSSR